MLTERGFEMNKKLMQVQRQTLGLQNVLSDPKSFIMDFQAMVALQLSQDVSNMKEKKILRSLRLEASVQT